MKHRIFKVFLSFSIKAINQTVNKEATIEFQINDKDKNITVADLPEGYTANFKASKEVFKETKTTSTTGELKNDFEGKFTYEVEILKDGKVVHTSKRAEVTVEDQSKIVTEFEIVTDKNTLVGEEKATIKVMGKTKDMAKDAEPKDITNHSKINFTTSPIALATGALTENKEAYEVTAKAGRKGEVTVTVKVEGLEDQTVKLQVTNEARKVDASQSTISTEAVKVATDAKETFTVELKDQYGDAVTGAGAAEAEAKLTVEGFDGAKATAVEDKEKPGTYTVTVTGGEKAAKGDFTVKVGDTEIGKVAVEVQEAGEVATWELKPSITEIDLKNVTNKSQEVQFTVVAKDEKGLTVTDHGKELVLKKDGKIVDAEDLKVTLNDLKVGQTFEFELFEQNGALVDSLGAKATVTVVDTTPVLKDVVFTSHPAVTEATAIDLDKILKVTAEGSKGEVKVAYTVAEDAKSLTIVEADKDGNAPVENAVELGTVELTNLPEGLNVKFAQDDQTGKVTVDVALNAAATDNAAGINKGSFNIAVLDKDKNFVKDTNVDVNLTTVDATDLADSVEELKFFVKGIKEGNKEKAVTIAEINEAMKENNVEIKAENLQLKDGKLSITGPLLTPEAWETLKSGEAANKDIPYRVTVAKADGTKAFKIAISKDGTAVFEAIKQ